MSREIKFKFYQDVCGEIWSSTLSLSAILSGVRPSDGLADGARVISQCQCTGLRDSAHDGDLKYANRIFEGDVIQTLKHSSMPPLEVKSVDGYSGFCIEVVPGGYTQLDQSLIHTQEFVVIGNVHQNPELLK